MTTLTKAETDLLVAAASRPDAAIVLPTRMKPVSIQRLVGRLTSAGLIRPGQEGEPDYVLIAAGYRAVGLRAPRPKRQIVEADGKPVTKKALIVELLARDEGASLGELIDATGWLPHTTRAALSRLRSAGTALERNARSGGTVAYRIAQAAA